MYNTQSTFFDLWICSGLLLRIVFREAAYMFVQSFKCLNIFGT